MRNNPRCGRGHDDLHDNLDECGPGRRSRTHAVGEPVLHDERARQRPPSKRPQHRLCGRGERQRHQHVPRRNNARLPDDLRRTRWGGSCKPLGHLHDQPLDRRFREREQLVRTGSGGALGELDMPIASDRTPLLRGFRYPQPRVLSRPDPRRTCHQLRVLRRGRRLRDGRRRPVQLHGVPGVQRRLPRTERLRASGHRRLPTKPPLQPDWVAQHPACARDTARQHRYNFRGSL